MADLYTRVAERTGKERATIKAVALGLLYSPACPDTEREVEEKLVEMFGGDIN